MTWTNKILEQLAASLPCGYQANGFPATEPTALAAVACAVHEHNETSRIAADWLSSLQARDGSVGVTPSQSKPKWPTSLAVLAWIAAGRNQRRVQKQGSQLYETQIKRAVDWMLDARGSTVPNKPHVGHDTMLTGWSWAADTHSWLEPTAYAVLALDRAGQASHPRAIEGTRLLIDRLLPEGGTNYGNTVVLGQPLLPHIHSTGLAMLALANQASTDPRIEMSLQYLERELPSTVPIASLCYGLLGLTAHNRRPSAADQWLQSAHQREQKRGPSPHKLALIALAALPEIKFLARFLNSGF